MGKIKAFFVFILIFLIFSIGAYFLTDKVIMPIVVGAYKTDINVPNLVGKNYNDAKSILDSLKLKLVVEDRDYNSDYGVDTLFYQNPPSGNFVKSGRGIRVRISKGGRVMAVPYLYKLDSKAAVARLNKYGFVLGRMFKEFNDTIDVDCVFNSAPKYGMILMKGAPIDIWVSKGSFNKVVKVPLFINKSISNAVLNAKQLGLSIGSISKTIVDSVVPETVIGQTLSPGIKVPNGTTINFTISSME